MKNCNIQSFWLCLAFTLIMGGCGDESSSNSYREQVSSHTVQSVEDYKERVDLRSEATKEVMEILSESIDLQELDKVVGGSPEFARTFSGNNQQGDSDIVARSLKVDSTASLSDLSQFSILDKLAFADNTGQLERVLKKSDDAIGPQKIFCCGKITG